MTPVFELLPWDSGMLGFQVARLLPSHLSSHTLRQALATLKEAGVHLVYGCVDPTDLESCVAASEQNGKLVDEKTTYVLDLHTIKDMIGNETIDYYEAVEPDETLQILALESGKFSRFLKDERIGRLNFEKIYRQWIINSCHKTIADNILVVREKGKILGMATVGKKKNRGDIGLLAVLPSAQGKGVGTRLLHSVHAYFYKNNTPVIQVVTQKENIPACRLYEKCHFKIESIQHFYHFWLR
ncbi:MAG: GNAT family N-acetyltransferase [Gammaproteobacteria bacterium]|nr:GNAT family N-acetyltransferase [Gammaproteobacteria bacterium]